MLLNNVEHTKMRTFMFERIMNMTVFTLEGFLCDLSVSRRTSINPNEAIQELME